SVSPEKLRKLPYVPPAVWDQVSVTGKTPAEVLVRISTLDGTVKYRVVAEPTQAEVTVPIISLTAKDVAGKVVVEDNLVTLVQVAGKAANGTISLLSSKLDFRGEATQMGFDLKVNGLELKSLPETWGLRNRLDGQLVGKANLQLTVRDGKL